MRWFAIVCLFFLAACASVPPAAPPDTLAVASPLDEAHTSNTNDERKVKVGLWLGVGLGVVAGMGAAVEVGEAAGESIFDMMFGCLFGDCGDDD